MKLDWTMAAIKRSRLEALGDHETAAQMPKGPTEIRTNCASNNMVGKGDPNWSPQDLIREAIRAPRPNFSAIPGPGC